MSGQAIALYSECTSLCADVKRDLSYATDMLNAIDGKFQMLQSVDGIHPIDHILLRNIAVIIKNLNANFQRAQARQLGLEEKIENSKKVLESDIRRKQAQDASRSLMQSDRIRSQFLH